MKKQSRQVRTFFFFLDILKKLCPFIGAKSVHSAALPKEPPFLLLEDLHHNHTDSSTHSLIKSNTHTVKHTVTDARSPTETHVETLSTDTQTQLEIHSDMLTVTDSHFVKHSKKEPDTHTAALAHVQQVSAVQAANTERYE